MDYKTYHESYYNYRKAKYKVKDIQNSLAEVISSLLSVSSKIRDNVSYNSNSKGNKILDLTSKKEELETKEVLALKLLRVREKRKNEEEKKLRESKDIKDIIYFKYYIDHIKPKDIAIQIIYTREYVYSLLKQIKLDVYNLECQLNKKNTQK